MVDIWLISDTHMGHDNILKFTDKDGNKLRPWENVQDMHDAIIENWNSVVKPQDKVYHLGDVAFKDWALRLFLQCNGHKRLVMGNHDSFKSRMYLEVFEELYGVRQINRVWLSHVPMHWDSVAAPRVLGNAHGHLHSNRINNKKYFNCSVECINYTPIHIEEVIKQFER